MKSLDLESSEFVVWDLFMTTFLRARFGTCWMHLRSANVRRPVPNVRGIRHDLEIQGRFASILGWSCWCLGKTCFLHNFCTVSSIWFYFFQTLFLRWLEIPRGSSGFDSQGLDVEIFSIYENPWKQTWQWKTTFSNGWVFPLSSLVFEVFQFDLSRLSCWGCLAPIHLLKERKSAHCFFRNCPGESSGWCHVSP